MGEREAILGCHDPADLFGTLDPRELRRAYARMAREWRDDDEVAAHLKALFDRARRGAIDGERPRLQLEASPPEASPPAEASLVEPSLPPPPPPSTVAEQLEVALQRDAVDRVLHLLVFHYRDLQTNRRDLVHGALRVLLTRHGMALEPEAVAQLQAVLLDPVLSFDPTTEARLLHHTVALQEWVSLRRDPAIPEALATCLQTAWWDTDPASLAETWNTAAQALRGQPLQPAFATLEARYPACLGRWMSLETRIFEARRRTPPLQRGSRLERIYGPGEAADRLWCRIMEPFAMPPPLWWQRGLAAGAALLVALVQTMHFLETSDAATQGVTFALGMLALGFAAFWLWTVLEGRQLTLDRAREHARGLEPLLDEAREQTLFPRELAREIAALGASQRQGMDYAEGHPLLELARSPWALLAVMGPDHVRRVVRG